MATYSTVKGFAIQSLASDPVTSVAAAGTWASSPALNTARKNPGGIGLAAAAVCVAGQPDSPTVTDAVEEYNGSSWSTVTAIPVAQCFMASGGILTAGWVTAGNDDGGGNAPFPLTMNLYDGTNWTTGNPILTGRYAATGSGPTTSAFIAGGAIPPGTPGGVTTTEKYNGTSWTASGAMNTARYSGMSSGTATAGLIAGGHSSGSLTANAEIFNGSTWTETGDLNLARQRGAVGGGTATSTSALVVGGYQDSSPPLYVTVNTEFFNGTTWTEVANLGAGVAGQGFATSGGTSALSFGGDNPPTSEKTTTEVWTVPSTVSIVQEGQVWFNSASNILKGYGKTAGTGAWASGGTLNTPYMYSGTAFGTQTAAVFAGGIPGDVTTTQTYNGIAWAASPATLNVGRHYFNCAGVGTSTAGLTFGGEVAAPPYDTTSSESFNGSTWTSTNGLTTSRHSICGGGTQAAAIAMTGGFGTGNSGTNVESWNGTCWTATTAAPHSKKYAMGGGTQTSAFTAGGVQYPPSITALSTSETWNGSAWTEVGAINTARGNGGRAGGSSTDGLIFGGSPPPALAVTEQWDGSTWTEVGDLGTAAASNAGTGTTSEALSVGNGSPNNGQTEEWTVPYPLSIKTFTSS